MMEYLKNSFRFFITLIFFNFGERFHIEIPKLGDTKEPSLPSKEATKGTLVPYTLLSALITNAYTDRWM